MLIRKVILDVLTSRLFVCKIGLLFADALSVYLLDAKCAVFNVVVISKRKPATTVTFFLLAKCNFALME